MSVQEELREIDRKVDGLVADMATIKARIDTSAPTNAANVAALFTSKDEHTKRIAAIERDYVKRDEFGELVKRTNALELNVSKHIGILIAIVAVVQFLGVAGIAAIVKWGGGK